MSFLSQLKDFPDQLAVPLCRFFTLTDAILLDMKTILEDHLDRLAAQTSEEAMKAKKVLSEKLLIISKVRACVRPTKAIRSYWEEKGAMFALTNRRPGDGIRDLRDLVLRTRNWVKLHPGEDEKVIEYVQVIMLGFRCFNRDELTDLAYLDEMKAREMTYLSLILARFPYAMRDLEDTAVVNLRWQPEDDDPLDVGQFGFAIRPYDRIREAASRLNKGESALLALIVRQYRRAFDSRFKDLTFFRYAAREMGDEVLTEISLRAIPLVMQLAEDIAPDIPEGEELHVLIEEGIAEPILYFRKQTIVRYATTDAWPLASLLRIMNVHLRFIIDRENTLSATEFLDFIFNSRIREETIRENLSKEHGLMKSITSNLTMMVQDAPEHFVRALYYSFGLLLPVLREEVAACSDIGLALKGTPVETLEADGVAQILAGTEEFLKLLKESSPRPADCDDPAALMTILEKEMPHLSRHIEETISGQTFQQGRERFRGLIAVWSLAVVLLRRKLQKESVADGEPATRNDLLRANFRLIMLGTSELIRRFNLMERARESASVLSIRPAADTQSDLNREDRSSGQTEATDENGAPIDKNLIN